MRLTTLIGVALIALSTAAIAQVASTPAERKNNATAPVNATTPSNSADDATTTTTNNMTNATDDMPVGAAPGDPTATTDAPPK